MKKFFGKQRWNKVLSVVLAMTLVAGTVGMDQMFVNAEDVVYPAGVPTVKELNVAETAYGSRASCEDRASNGVHQGVQMSLAANGYQRLHSQYRRHSLLDGYYVNIEDFNVAENDAMLIVMGTQGGGSYIDSTSGTYGIVYEYDGDFVVMEATTGTSLMSDRVVRSATKLAPQNDIDKLSIYVKSDGTKWDLVVNTYKAGAKVGDTYTTTVATTVTETYFSFGAVNAITIADETTATITSWTNKSALSYMISYMGIPVQSVSLNTPMITLSKGTTSALQATISPTTAVNKTLTWSSSDNNIATVDGNGNVTAVEEGVATITAISSDDGTKKATCEVSVVKSNLSADDFTANKSKMTYANAEDGAGVKVVYSTEASSWERIATKDTYSVEDKLQIQIDDIQATDVNYSIVIAIGNASNQWYDKAGYMLLIGKSGKVAIVESSSTVQSPNNQTTITTGTMNELNGDISLVISQSNSNYIIEVNGTEYSIPNATSVLASGGEHYLAFGVMSDFAITDGDVSGVKYYHDGVTIGRTQDVSFVIRNITSSVSNIKLENEYLNMMTNESVSLTATVTPTQASQSINWDVSDETIATVDANGNVTAVKAGTTIITATSKIDASVSASCVVKVTNPAAYITSDMLSNAGSWPTVENTAKGVKVSYSADTASWRRIDGAYSDKLKHGYWAEGNGVHIGLKDIQLTNDSDAIAVFIGDEQKSTGVHDSLWYDAEEGGYMLFYSKGGSFSIVKIIKTAKTETVLVSETRELLGDRLSLDVRFEDGKYEFSVNGITYSIPGDPNEDTACPISKGTRVYFSFGLVPGFGVIDGVVTGPNFSAATYGSDGTFTLTNISHITTEELTLPVYSQHATLTGFEGKYVIGGEDVVLTTSLGTTKFDGTANDPKEGVLWDIAAVGGVEDGYTVKQTGGTQYLNISGTGVSCSEAAQTLYITRTRTTTTAYTTISDGANYLCVSSEGVSVSTTLDKLILYSVTPELPQVTEEEPLFTLSAFADLHGERIYYNGTEEYIRDGIIDATKKVGQEENANVIAFLGDLISSKSTSDNIKGYDGYWDYYQRGAAEEDRSSVLEQWQTARDAIYTAAASATKSGRALYLAGNHEFKIGSLNAADNGGAFNSGDYTDGIQSHLPQLISGDNAYYQAEWPEGTSEAIKTAGHVLSYHYNIDGMDILAINTTYTGTEITSGWNYDLGALDWMENKLEEIGEDKTVIVLGHYPTESLNNSVGQQSYTKIKSIFAKYPNVIYLTGHTHDPYIHTDTYERVETFAKDAYTAFDNRYEAPTGYVEAFAGSVAFTNDIGLSGCAEDGTAAVVQGLLVKVYSDRIVLQMKNYNESPLGVDELREYTIMRDVKLNVEEDPQVAQVEEYTTAFANFRDGEVKEAPIAPKGYVFAGWYYDEACTQPVAVETTTVAEDKQIFAKFLPQDVLSVKAQLKLVEGTIDSTEGKTEMRLITTVDSKLDYQDVGFCINNKAYRSEYAYTSLMAAGFEKTPEVFNPCSKKFVTRNIINLKWNTTNKPVDRDIKVQAFWTTCDGTTVYGQERIITIRQGLDAIASSGTTDYSLR